MSSPKIGHDRPSVVRVPPAVLRIPCGIGTARLAQPEARYALEHLLVPLGLEPDWAGSSSSATGGGGSVGIWYGASDEVGPPGWIHVTADPGDTLDGIRDGIDPVRTAWWWLSGEGERMIPERDRFGRVPFDASWHRRWNLGDRAPVDEARDRLARRLREAGVRLYPRGWDGRQWAFCPTHDIDYLRKVRPGIVWREGVERLLLGRGGGSLADRGARAGRFARQALPGRDPFTRALFRIADTLERKDATATWFFKAGAHGPHDVSYPLDAAPLRRLVPRLLERGHEIGLHPGFHAFAHGAYLAEEAARLAAATGVSASAMRTHYLRWHEPATPRAALDAGFSIDSTLGFADASAFRRGTCLPFRPWDPVAGRAHDLWEMPLSVMESALFNRQGLGVDAAVEATASLASTARRHGGALVALWHNTLWDEDEAPGWGSHFERTLELASSQGAALTSLSSALASWSPEPE